MPTPDRLKLPDLYVIGAPKAGTTSVAAWLAQHPDVYWSVPKEPFYWASDFPGLRSHYGFDTIEAYRELFSSPAAQSAVRRGEGSTFYLYSQPAPGDILAAVPHARFVACVREPAAQVLSFHRSQLVALNEDEPDLGRAWKRSLAGGLPGVTPLDPKLVDYPLIGRQGEAVARWADLVGRDNLHVIVVDDLASDPARVWADLLEFAGLDASFAPDFQKLNASNKTYRSKAMHQLTHRPPKALAPAMRRFRQWSRTTSMPGVRRLKKMAWRPEARPDTPPEVSREIAAHFADDVELMGKLLDRDLSHWTTKHA
jgi:hypothetical protein